MLKLGMTRHAQGFCGDLKPQHTHDASSWSISSFRFIIKLFYLELILDLQKTCKYSVQSCCISFTGLSLILAFCITMVHLSKLRDLCWYNIVINYRLYSDFPNFSTNVLFCSRIQFMLHLVILSPYSLLMYDNFIFPVLHGLETFEEQWSGILQNVL